ncbi:hypothetical protein [Rahnella aquatilis]|uniref:Uncharacterized protein n=1 Tax=Rahnella aquatilis (strain ATCC 33071 / DSM 4594 / JCM 1683 / NBRC 105701 / NCIMB 13365 / CIP 78.65) TaxID=745277 RepID=H2IPT0_RAHAC|nr:hypothetical protein [Rahnella aquatilis]AEX51247.1 hypothetical protein Rahaq2_1367 [Rahnella aquatilis CIP 78.65 = ATCC 33071]KFD17720.1 hypothetical protein GRAQ_00403 [Rahnella aquatilis CIP 78.65 = ATCC 33071]
MFRNLKTLCNYALQKSQGCTFTGEINAWVLIWYPENHHLGHAAMIIGDLDVSSPYVSWWPEKTRSGLSAFILKTPAAREKLYNHKTHHFEFTTSDYESDFLSEEDCPHVIYGLRDFDTRSMLTTWEKIMSRGCPSFSPLSKNCAAIVSRVMKAGLKNHPLRHKVFGIFGGEQYIWTPKRIAVACNTLRDKNCALKINISGRNSQHSFVKTLIRLR